MVASLQRHCTKSGGGLYINSTCFYVGSTRKFRAKFRNREPDVLASRAAFDLDEHPELYPRAGAFVSALEKFCVRFIVPPATIIVSSSIQLNNRNRIGSPFITYRCHELLPAHTYRGMRPDWSSSLHLQAMALNSASADSNTTTGCSCLSRRKHDEGNINMGE